MKRAGSLLTFIAIVTVLVAAVAWSESADPNPLTAHEWGTFTSVAGANGQPIAWRSYSGSSDLPGFVERFAGSKNGLYATVRMETPVLYFYGKQETTANVKVLFPKGVITEWYPKAVVSRSYDAIEWRDIQVLPGGTQEFPIGGLSHYYAARKTGAASLQVESQREKFLFYRGAGTFPLPVTAKTTEDGRVQVQNISPDPVEGVILFENRAGRLRYHVSGRLEDQIVLDPGSLQNDLPGLLAELERILVEQGLYLMEARAMIETWRDSWFEEGTRLFYIVPRRATDSILPLDIQPAPSQIERVFVGRMEIITADIQEAVRLAIAEHDQSTLVKYGRFLEAIAKRIGVATPLLD